MAKQRKLNKQQRLEKAKADLEKTLRQTGFRLAQAKYGKDKGYKFPDLSVENSSKKYASLGNGFGKTPGKKQLPEGAKQFPVGVSHKQGQMLITGFDNPADMNGKKT